MTCQKNHCGDNHDGICQQRVVNPVPLFSATSIALLLVPFIGAAVSAYGKPTPLALGMVALCGGLICISARQLVRSFRTARSKVAVESCKDVGRFVAVQTTKI